ncbi:Alpha/Beta hydrolase protein [Aspergillus granulosus]|uniref:Carboxylic ester hydrolase n=1 Tax=Aspergillus granulosus TaxID=176169 RepID=A0ABR4HA54_9EURO
MKLLVTFLLPLAASELTVSTTSGTVQGFYNDSSTQTVRAFLGIPYAEPPVGSRRWAPPVPKKSPKSRLDGREYGPSDNGIYSVLPYSPPQPDYISEDCLSLNIWSPSSRHANVSAGPKKAAVLVFIHGGAFIGGTSAVAFYDGAPFVRDNDNVIVVIFNYRLGIFGYPNAPGLSEGQQNVGLLDQRLAIEWVRDNISRFGGDPKRITLFGQSAGAISADMYAYAYPKSPLVYGIVLQSGTATLFSSSDFMHSSWKNVSEALGCTQHDPARNLKCMRKLAFRNVLQAAAGQIFIPVQDNVTVSNCSHRVELGKLARVRYQYHGNWTNLSPVPWLGAYHSSELPLVFGTYNLSQPTSRNQVLASKYIQGMALYTWSKGSQLIFGGAWAAFAHDPYGGLSAYGWPMYDPQELANSPEPVFTKDPLGGSCGLTN